MKFTACLFLKMYFDKGRAARLGCEGENRVAEYLRRKGYIIVKRNWRCGRYGEIDIIAEKGNIMTFVEVKTRTEGSIVSGIEAVDKGKLARTVNAAQIFMKRLESPLEPRIDVAEVTVLKNADGTDAFRLKYLKNVW